jgi:DNA-binding NarL/FixJ family response regulator
MEESKRTHTLINTLIVEDHGLMAEAIRDDLEKNLEENLPMVKVVAIARNPDEARLYADKTDKDNKIDLIIMDIRLNSDIDGITLGAELKKKSPDLRVLIYRGEDNEELLRRAKNANMNGFVSKTNKEDLRKAVNVIVNNGFGFYIGESLPEPRAETEHLTPKETETLKLIAKGKKDEEICQERGIGETTLKTHCTHIRHKRGLKDKLELYQYAIKCYPN